MRLPAHPWLWLACRLVCGGHAPYTHRHRGEPDITYCLRCRTTLEAADAG